MLASDPIAEPVTKAAIDSIRELFAAGEGTGVAIPEAGLLLFVDLSWRIRAELEGSVCHFDFTVEQCDGFLEPGVRDEAPHSLGIAPDLDVYGPCDCGCHERFLS